MATLGADTSWVLLGIRPAQQWPGQRECTALAYVNLFPTSFAFGPSPTLMSFMAA